MRLETWTALEAQFAKYPFMRAEPVPVDELETAAEELRVVLPQDYVEFVARYGGAVVGPLPIIGLRAAEPMDAEESSIVAVTKRYRAEGWTGLDQIVVISIDHAGNPIGLAADGTVWCSDHDAGEFVRIADSFEAFLWNRCLKAEHS